MTPWTEIPEEIYEVPNNFGTPTQPNPNALPQGPDPLIQTTPPFRQGRVPIQNFDGATVAEGQAIPPDPSGAVGPNHYVHAVNLVVKIFDKQGTLLSGPTFLGTFFGTGNNSGAPIVLYDQLADRWFVSQFRIGTGLVYIAVSTSPDPTGSYHQYVFDLGFFPDYPHYTVYPNAYYMTANKAGLTTFAFEREKMIAGEPAQFVGFGLSGGIRNPNTVFSPEPANLVGQDFPDDLPGYIVYLQDDSWSSAITEDHLKIWDINMDWETPGNSTISAPYQIPTAPFDSFFFPFGSGDIQQPGTGQRVDAINGVISYMANYRSFDTHNSFLVNFNTDLATNTNEAGIRWIELRNTNPTDQFTIYQEGTWTLNDGLNRFMGSMGIDDDGNIGLAYHIGNNSTRIGIRYTGRMEGDPLGTMTVAETSIIEGNGVQTNTNRLGDYAQMTMDIDNRTMWHTAEYFSSNNFWRTRIASFKLAPDLTNDVGVYNFVTPKFAPFGSSENVEVSLANFGTAAQSNFDIELTLDGNLVATETFTGTINPGETATYTFSGTVDLSATDVDQILEARTLLGSDQATDNDEFAANLRQDGSLGVNDNLLTDRNLLVYPVNERNYIIRFNTTNDFGDVSFRILNLLGQDLYQGEMERQAGFYQGEVDMGAVASGVYLIEVGNGSEKATKKIMVR